jgi:hypothetical protein
VLKICLRPRFMHGYGTRCCSQPPVYTPWQGRGPRRRVGRRFPSALEGAAPGADCHRGRFAGRVRPLCLKWPLSTWHSPHALDWVVTAHAHAHRAGGPDAGAVLDELAQRLTHAEEVCTAGERSSETLVKCFGIPDEVGPLRMLPRPPTFCQPTTHARCGAALRPPNLTQVLHVHACRTGAHARQPLTTIPHLQNLPAHARLPCCTPCMCLRACALSPPQVGLAIQALKSRVEGARVELLPRRRFAFASRPRAPAGALSGAATAAAGAARSTAAAAVQPAGDERALSGVPARSCAAVGPADPGGSAEVMAACDAAGGGASDTLDTDWCLPLVA